MRIGDGGLLQVHVYRMWAFLIVTLHLHNDLRTMDPIPTPRVSYYECRDGYWLYQSTHRAPKRVHRPRCDLECGAVCNRELPVHASGRDSHPLSAARLTELVELRPIKQLAEYAGDLALDNSRAVILDHDPQLPGALVHLNDDIWQYAGFLAGVESVVHRLFDSSHQRFGRRIKTK